MVAPLAPGGAGVATALLVRGAIPGAEVVWVGAVGPSRAGLRAEGPGVARVAPVRRLATLRGTRVAAPLGGKGAADGGEGRGPVAAVTCAAVPAEAEGLLALYEAARLGCVGEATARR